jgi:transglutaminase-like putative cysteine protease
MIRPRDSHDLRVLDARLILSPSGDVRWMHDVFSNSITLIRFRSPASELMIESHVFVEHFPSHAPEFPIREFAETFPFTYPSDQIPDLGRTNECHYADPDRRLLGWARRFLDGRRPPYPTMELLIDIMNAIKQQFRYETRYEEGTQTPLETLDRGIGTCRDYALFMMEAVRSLGLAARFVTGYLYDPKIDGGGDVTVGASATHAWVQIYLPGAGWVEFDPTNAIVGGANLIRVGVARDPGQALPLRGTYEGAVEDYLGIDVDVKVRAVNIAAA